MAKTADPPEAEDIDQAGVDNLKALGAALAAGIDDAVEQNRVLAKIVDQVTALSPATLKVLRQQPAIRTLIEMSLDAEQPVSRDDPPGTVYNHPQFGKYNKKVWTEGDMRRRVESGEFTMIGPFIPIVTIPIWFQSLRRQLVRGEETTVESPFYAIYLDHLKALRVAEEHAAWMFDTPDQIGQKHRRRPSDPTVIGPDSSRVRAGAGTREVGEGFGDLITATTARGGDAA